MASGPCDFQARAVLISQTFAVASVAVFLYDYSITLGMESQYIWPAKWNFMKFLFLLQRYMPFVDTCFMVLHRTSSTFVCTPLVSFFSLAPPSSTDKFSSRGILCYAIPWVLQSDLPAQWM